MSQDDSEAHAARRGVVPVLADDFFETMTDAPTPIRRGRPRSGDPKLLVSLRLDRVVVERFRAGGSGWQARLNAVLRKAVDA